MGSLPGTSNFSSLPLNSIRGINSNSAYKNSRNSKTPSPKFGSSFSTTTELMNDHSPLILILPTSKPKEAKSNFLLGSTGY